MKRGRRYLRWLMPMMAVGFLSFAQTSFAQDDVYQPNDNSGNYDNSGDYENDEALIQPENDVNYNTFHDELSPYGTWRDYPGYGNVWVCNVAGFSPYNTGGHWAYTRFGWTWVSDYNWGWAPFHYGRWGYDNAFGYFWVPGYTWGPAWVSWRNGGDYYGWAPLSPGLSVGINVGIGIGAASWTFLPHRYMGYRNSYNYYAPRQNNVTIIRNTTIINNTHVYNNNRFVVGPDRRQVERYSGQRIQQQNIVVTNNRNDNRQVNNGIRMYHPNVNRGVANNNRNGFQNGQPINRAAQDNVRQQPNGNGRINGAQQQPVNGVNGTASDNRQLNRLQQRRDDRIERRDRNDDGNGVLNNGQRQQDLQNMRNRMQQNNDQQGNQQQDVQRQQQLEQRQQQMNDRRAQMQQRQQERSEQQQQQMQQQRQDQMQQQRQQQMQQRQQMDQQRQQMQQQRQQQMQQQRQQQFQQRSQNVNRPMQQGGGRRGRN